MDDVVQLRTVTPGDITMDHFLDIASSRFSYRSRLKVLFLGLSLLLLPPLPVKKQGASGDGQPTPHDKLSAGENGRQRITFVHVSDIHARYNPDKDGASFLGRIRGYYERAKNENPFTLLTNAGDDYEKGSVAEELSRGQTSREVTMAMRYDVRTLGNHDFAWGLEEFLRFSSDPSATVVASNTSMTPGSGHSSVWPAPGWTNFSIKTLGKIRIGFFGMVSRPWDERNTQYDGQFYPKVRALKTDFDFMGRARDIIARHRQEVDLLVLLSHLGIEDDCALAAGTQGIDLILGGHSHTTMEEPLRVNDTTIIHAGAFAETFGRYDIEYDVARKVIAGSSYRLVVNRPGDIPEDPRTSGKIAEILKKYQSAIGEPIARIGQDQDEQAMALIAARAAVDTMKIDAALIGMDSVGDRWSRGQLTSQDVLNAFRVERQPAGTPGQTSLYLVTVRGADLLHANAVSSDFVFYGPKAIHPGLLYTVAMQKNQAFHQKDCFGRIIGVSRPRPAAEIWETVVAYARTCNEEGLALDEDPRKLKDENLVALLQYGNSALETVQ